MRVIGEINHPKYKISVFQTGEKISLQMSDGLTELTVKFRDGMNIMSLEDVKKYLDHKTMSNLESQIQMLRTTHSSRLSQLWNEEFDFPEII